MSSNFLKEKKKTTILQVAWVFGELDCEKLSNEWLGQDAFVSVQREKLKTPTVH